MYQGSWQWLVKEGSWKYKINSCDALFTATLQSKITTAEAHNAHEASRTAERPRLISFFGTKSKRKMTVTLERADCQLSYPRFDASKNDQVSNATADRTSQFLGI